MEVYVPIPKCPLRQDGDRDFSREDFRYDAEDDSYVCPVGQRLTRRGSTTSKGKRYLTYYSTASVCRECPLSSRCLLNGWSNRNLRRWEHEDVIDRHRKKMSASGPLMRQRGTLVEHPFGTLKRWAGMDHFLMRRLHKCRGEFSLMVLSYNFKRVVNELGVDAFREYCARKQRVGAIGA